MTRRQFIESHGASCKNWQWSWSFINKAERFVIFGAWDRDTKGTRTMILSEDWKTREGRKSKGYDQSREHIRLVEEDGYRLKVFPMQYSDAKKGSDGNGPAKIGGFTPVLLDRKLTPGPGAWYAADSDIPNSLPEEISKPEKYFEGARFTVTINAYERNPKARAACIAHHGYQCAVCGFDFVKVYGSWGEDFIHVHHVLPIGEIGEQYEVDPKSDLIPVCPNCHAMIHRADPPLTVAQLRSHVRDPK